MSCLLKIEPGVLSLNPCIALGHRVSEPSGPTGEVRLKRRTCGTGTTHLMQGFAFHPGDDHATRRAVIGHFDISHSLRIRILGGG